MGHWPNNQAEQPLHNGEGQKRRVNLASISQGFDDWEGRRRSSGWVIPMLAPYLTLDEEP